MEFAFYYNKTLKEDLPDSALDLARGARCARAATMLLLGLPGSMYLYQ